MADFLRIGHRLVNLDRVTDVDLENNRTRDGIELPARVVFFFGQTVDGEFDSASFSGEEAEAVREYFDSNTDVVNITPAVALEDSPL